MVTQDPGRGAPLIAIVDDDAGVLESLENLFESCGYRVRGFASAGAFLETDVLFSADCLISDISMPDMDGITLQNRVAMDRPGLPVILITARHDLPHSGAVAANNRGYFHKPVDPFALLEAVAAVLRV
jgi:FixJ family two-component response regulator